MAKNVSYPVNQMWLAK